MKKRLEKKKGKVIFIILNLIISIIAFSFLIGISNIQNVYSITEEEIAKAAKEMGTTVEEYKAEMLREGSPSTPNPSQSAGTPLGISDTLNGLLQDTLIGSLFWAGMISGGVTMLAGMFGVSGDNQKALFMATFAGVMTQQVLSPIAAGGEGWTFKAIGEKAIWANKLPWLSQEAVLLVAVGVGLLVLNMLWTKKSKKLVTFTCNPYEPPVGGKYCELCNKDKFRPCSEYRCKSLGQACELLNAGTGKEACAWVNRQDVTSPTIFPWQEILSKEHEYKDIKTRPPGTGMRIIKSGATDGCIKAFTPLTFGIQTNEPAQCKIDYNHTTTIRDVKKAYENMQYYFGESNIYEYNHSQTLRLPGPVTINSSGSPEIIHDGTFTLYVRCRDANGNVNEDEFAIRFCVDKGPDTTPPKIEGTSIPNGYPVAFDTNETEIEVYVNEPSDCKWSREDKDYDLMESTMSCDRDVFDMNNNMLYKCITTLNGLENRKENKFYFRCRDQPNLPEEKKNDRITNQESYGFIIKGSRPLNILSVKPNGTIQGHPDVVSVDLLVETGNGYNKGDAICYFSQTNKDEDFIKMFETGSSKHKQRQDLTARSYAYYFKCVDLGGNTDYNQTRFTVEIDKIAPAVIRVYKEGGNLKIVTDEKSSCSYSTTLNQKCNFEIDEGTAMPYSNSTEHFAEWKSGTNYFIKCQDASGNQPNTLDCSVIARAYNSASS